MAKAKKKRKPTETAFTMIDGKEYGTKEFPPPKDRRFRGAWTFNGKAIVVDFKKAKAMVENLIGAAAVAKAKTVADLEAAMKKAGK